MTSEERVDPKEVNEIVRDLTPDGIKVVPRRQPTTKDQPRRPNERKEIGSRKERN